MPTHASYMRLALRLARRGCGTTSPNPMVGAVVVQGSRVIGRGWHERAGGPHAEITALRQAQQGRHRVRGATLYVTLEPCSTRGRTPPCTEAIIGAGLSKVVAGATDPNPRHGGRGFTILRRAGLAMVHGVLAEECERLNEAFNHWIVRRTPFVTVKAAMTLDGKIATAAGESKWITGAEARHWGLKLRQGADAILAGINTVLADDPSLTVRVRGRQRRRIVLDAMARTPLGAKVVSDEQAALTTIVVSKSAPKERVAALAGRVKVLVAPVAKGRRRQAGRGAPGPPRLDLRWLLKRLGAEEVTSLLVEGGGEVNASFLFEGLAQRIAFFYAPKVLGGREARPAVAGAGARTLDQTLNLSGTEWRRLGPDWLLSARVESGLREGTRARM
ncbi:MAG: bifunctional diaminohydroxyphosphoribosylaminopyrimidine deaminase/5-amino-6-(5-phosphoribosylamino)uracil reductase RibD [Verrucomicrobiota bacterium]